ncbi:dipeptide ABC transporter ATP-binding protein [Pararhodobacter aggregans]|uniref:Microcin ABC transporter ATP-binding protein n=1 Tax=Pararhodobacter aggregans TaxID=404875 RepID=A0A2T7UMB2_9RHOB|nr:ABC transporter ATP-binding protein [Pararhodobacter aggregans]PTX00025.1 peptide/nickel transport system ATP-binding protein/microcin C transport system ATP-binding protein [Pararhodobacter aggregans]PVE45778.1 microcin ABC transporter ATP-binding protein [Pararhodobacter aggregans]
MDALLQIEDLDVRFGTFHAVRGVSLHLARGEKLAIIGESGSGKSVTALSVMRLLDGAARTAGRILLQGEDVLSLSASALRQMRGRRVAMVFQDPMTSLNPVFPVGRQIGDVLAAHTDLSGAARRGRAIDLLAQVGIREAERCLTLYPHELSGGMRQRVMIALAIACDPALLIADEPTTALDVTVQEQITRLLVDLCRARGIGLLFISHNLDLVGEFADRIAVMHEGRIVEMGEAAQVMGAPRAEYTRKLLAAIPRIGLPGEGRIPDTPVVLETRAVSRAYPRARSAVARLWDRRQVQALRPSDLQVHAGQVLGIVGESGSGKSTLARLLIGLDLPTSGTVLLQGAPLKPRDRAGRRALSRRIQLVFQGSQASLNPRKTIRRALSEAMQALPRAERRSPGALMELVRLDPALLDRYPHQLSGGQRQRVGIARALATSPDILIADEPTSALDVSVQKEIIELLQALQRDLGMTLIVISHDLGLIGTICDRVLVMRAGAIVETGEARQVLTHPATDYTRALLASLPKGLAGRARFASPA